MQPDVVGGELQRDDRVERAGDQIACVRQTPLGSPVVPLVK